MIDQKGYRPCVAIIIKNAKGELFWARRIGQDSYQFPQGGIKDGETPVEAMYRELYEEVGLLEGDVKLVSYTRRWLRYDLPKKYIRYHSKPVCIGQKQKWFLLELIADESKINFNTTVTPEFDEWKWVNYWHPVKEVIDFKKRVYRLALKEFEPKVVGEKRSSRPRGYLARRGRRNRA